MTIFLRLLAEKDKAAHLLKACKALRTNGADPRLSQVAPESFRAIPGVPFAYWVSEDVRRIFGKLPALECQERTARQGLATAEDFRFVRAWWENPGFGWYSFAKGGAFSPFYADVYLMTKWTDDGSEIKAGICGRYPYLKGNAEFVAKNPQFYRRPGLTWPRRTQGGLSLRAMPQDCIFADKGPAIFVMNDLPEAMLALLALVNSRAFSLLVSLQMAFGSYEVGVIQKTPVPELDPVQKATLAALARRAWSLKRLLDTHEETSHAFLLPRAIRAQQSDYDPSGIADELARIQVEIDAIAFGLYGFSEADRAAAQGGNVTELESALEVDSNAELEIGEDEGDATPIDQTAALLSWAVGVAFGRFDWRLATGERLTPTEPDPFAPLPSKSPGMLPALEAQFHKNVGILVDDSGHPHDLARLLEEVCNRVKVLITSDARRWLQRDFFPFHLQRYSKSRRKAPIYWPLSTTSGSYTLWIYYPSLTSQTLYTAINDFIEPKLKQVAYEVAALRIKGSARSRDDERTFEALQGLEIELIEFRDILLQIAPTYLPSLSDGVQITAAPLWRLFRHKPWQKVLRDTWSKLEKGDYDWAQLARAYWPDRVCAKCKTDRSLAIAHDLEHLYVEPELKAAKARGRKKDEE